RARLIWAKIRLRQEFPMNFVEATSPIQDTPASGMRYIYLAPKQTYVAYLASASGGHHTWAACLYMALKQVRGGRDAHIEQTLSTNEILDRTGDGVLEIVDAWGNGLAMYRWPALNPEVDASCPGGPNKTNRDPHDPSARLMDPSWWQSP